MNPSSVGHVLRAVEDLEQVLNRYFNVSTAGKYLELLSKCERGDE